MATNESYETYEYDVLVIGAGGAGLRAAIEASAAGVRKAWVTRCTRKSSASSPPP